MSGYIKKHPCYYLFTIILGCVGPFLLCAGFSLAVASGATLRLPCEGFLLRGLLLFVKQGLRAHGLRWLGLEGSRAQPRKSWLMGLVALWLVGSSLTRERTCVPCIARWILNHWATPEAQLHYFI